MSDDAVSPALTWSDDHSEIFVAMAKAQAGMAALTKGKTAEVKNKNKEVLYTYQYAGLPETLQACLAAYNEQGLAILQPTRVFNNGVDVTTIITHSSGQWVMTAPLFLPVEFNGAQSCGSGITYARRYALQAMVGLSPADDDGGNAHGNKPAKSDRPIQNRPARNERVREPMCTGKLQPVADANRARRVELAGLASSSVEDVWLEACKRARVPAINGGAPEPEQLTKTHGLAVKELLDKWIMSKRADAPPPGDEADQRQPGDDDDYDPHAEKAP